GLVYAGERSGCDVEGDLARLLKEVHLAALTPGRGVFGDDALHERQVGLHVGLGEGGIPHLAAARPGWVVLVKQAMAHEVADDRRPAIVVAKRLPVCPQHELVRLRSYQEDDLHPGIRTAHDWPAE